MKSHSIRYVVVVTDLVTSIPVGVFTDEILAEGYMEHHDGDYEAVRYEINSHDGPLPW